MAKEDEVKPKTIETVNNILAVVWEDGHESYFDFETLRRACPCAQCVNEWTGQRTLQPESIADEVEINDLSIVGRYALNFRWSDNHETGIYSFQYLRDLCEH